MLESLRGLGYSTATAIADIIDNSITAEARNVFVHFHWKKQESYITIRDDGFGMSPEKLDLAMRLGEFCPLDSRLPTDLGRFGLGLKTASFSQCRRLTVSSRKDGQNSCLRWDLDYLGQCKTGDGWYLLEGPHESSKEIAVLPNEIHSGTLVLWEILDRVVPTNFSEQEFLEMIDKVERHLSMVFHRFLDNPWGLKIFINGRQIGSWDPFLSNNSFTWASPEEEIPGEFGAVQITTQSISKGSYGGIPNMLFLE